jgi:hypothetical protein
VEPPGCAQELVMKLMLLPTRSFPTVVAVNVVVSVVAVVIGSLIFAAPDRAAGIWASQRLANVTSKQRAVLVGWYRVLGICLCVAGILLAVDDSSP